MHLFGFIIKIYHDSLSPERQKEVVLVYVDFRVIMSETQFKNLTLFVRRVSFNLYCKIPSYSVRKLF